METSGFGSLTEHGDEGLGSSHGHSEDGASVFALVSQGHVADADAELMGCRLNQLSERFPKFPDGGATPGPRRGHRCRSPAPPSRSRGKRGPAGLLGRNPPWPGPARAALPGERIALW